MSVIPFSIIDAAKRGDVQAVQVILAHFEGYIANQCRRSFIEETGKTGDFVDEELRNRARSALLEGIFKFQYREPPEGF